VVISVVRVSISAVVWICWISLVAALIAFTWILTMIIVAFAIARLASTAPVGRLQRQANRRWADATPTERSAALSWDRP
jgi:hypothetical protein